ncbi:MAG: Translation initiation factor IF-1 [Candidatus Jorgensenbacteria bacterium GW2011_GWA2_45_13]|uniref:Translation initiation factor IF-1 n=1 Tax=Candidatus Jorgensenbacteria bacterium GW2011_GWA2_45_13 TaxID=1618662 RepID=A0A0G1P432_9BACT|nr:MAG: Translation initiation factor IF-1 [Candidatus Jorgensenbacteria bacterium GW2011_GWA2_45_13]
MANNSKFERVEGIVEEALPGLFFRVKAKIPKENGEMEEREILAHPAGRLKIHHIRVIPGDKVVMEMPNLNDRRARIVRRL